MATTIDLTLAAVRLTVFGPGKMAAAADCNMTSTCLALAKYSCNMLGDNQRRLTSAAVYTAANAWEAPTADDKLFCPAALPI